MNPVVAQLTLVLILLAFSLCGVPQRRRVEDRPVPVPVDPAGPAATLVSKVAPVAEALAGADDVDRALWAAVWERAGLVVEGDIGVAQPVMTTTKELRAFTVAMLQVAWQRLRNLPPHAFPKLDAALEGFLADPEVMGKDDVLLDDVFRAQYARAVRALAYAGRKRG